MSEEEKKAIGEIDISKTIKSNIDYWRNKCFEQQKELEQEKEKRKYYEEELEATIQQSISKHKIREKLDKKREEIKENCLVNGLSPDKAIYKKNVQIAMVDTIKKELLEERN